MAIYSGQSNTFDNFFGFATTICSEYEIDIHPNQVKKLIEFLQRVSYKKISYLLPELVMVLLIVISILINRRTVKSTTPIIRYKQSRRR